MAQKYACTKYPSLIVKFGHNGTAKFENGEAETDLPLDEFAAAHPEYEIEAVYTEDDDDPETEDDLDDDDPNLDDGDDEPEGEDEPEPEDAENDDPFVDLME